jgi:PKHD-type hydroxylase|tara:strand:- start:21 stop:662 length:642 start_codon:yes stop_codon:yes gene_type:complete
VARLTDEPVHLDLDLAPLKKIDTGGGAWPLQPNRQEQWAWMQNVFTPPEIKAIIAIGEVNDLDKARTGGNKSSKDRDSFVKFLFPNDATTWIFEKLSGVVTEMNARYWGFDLSGFEQGLQFTRYEAPGQHYDWHIDAGMITGHRKLSLTVQLSDPDDYEGGDLELRWGKDPMKANREQSMITVFPSWTMHRVTPVTRGRRFSLVAWVSGPPFK